jgi:biopolymer transport protein ExbB
MNLPSKHSLTRAIFLCLGFLLIAAPLLMGAEVNEEAGAPNETVFSLMKKGGLVMIPLGIASIIALALAVERLISLRKEKVLPSGFLDGLGQAWRSDPTGQKALEYCDRSGGAAGHVFKAGIEWRNYGFEAVSRAIEEAGSREAARMKRSVRGLSVIAGVCPLLGLMGTVFGLINAFQKTASSGGAAKPSDLAIGIYEALVTTATGLLIAVPVMLVYQYLSSRVDGLIDNIDEAGTEFIVKHARWDVFGEEAANREAHEAREPDQGAETVAV